MNLLNLFRPSKRQAVQPEVGERRAVVALGGGGARGLAHVGVMQSIAETGIRTERIVGVSMGSLVGAMCASDTDINRVRASIHLTSKSNKRFCSVLPRQAMTKMPVVSSRGTAGCENMSKRTAS